MTLFIRIKTYSIMLSQTSDRLFISECLCLSLQRSRTKSSSEPMLVKLLNAINASQDILKSHPLCSVVSTHKTRKWIRMILWPSSNLVPCTAAVRCVFAQHVQVVPDQPVPLALSMRLPHCGGWIPPTHSLPLSSYGYVCCYLPPISCAILRSCRALTPNDF